MKQHDDYFGSMVEQYDTLLGCSRCTPHCSGTCSFDTFSPVKHAADTEVSRSKKMLRDSKTFWLSMLHPCPLGSISAIIASELLMMFFL
jgi:hypothetical protein